MKETETFRFLSESIDPNIFILKDLDVYYSVLIKNYELNNKKMYIKIYFIYINILDDLRNSTIKVNYEQSIELYRYFKVFTNILESYSLSKKYKTLLNNSKIYQAYKNL